MFARIRAPGSWTNSSVVPGSQFEQLDANLAHALDAYGGGAYSLQTDILVGGSPGVDWVFDLPVTFNGPLVANDGVYLGSNSADAVIVNAQALFFSTVEFQDPVAFTDDVNYYDPVYYHSLAQYLGNCEMFGNVYMGSTSADLLLVSATSSFEGPVSFNEPVDVYDTWAFHAGFSVVGTASFANPVELNGGAVIKSPVSFTNEGRIPQRQAIGVNAALTQYSSRHYDHVFFPAGTLTGADINAKIDDTGAADGDRMRFSTNDTSSALVQILNPGNTVIAQIKYNASGDVFAVDVERIAGTWRIVGSSKK